MPNDSSELDRLDFVHALIGQVLDGKLHLAPIQTPGMVLDIGTGTGICAIDMGCYPFSFGHFRPLLKTFCELIKSGDTYPSAMILGIDLSPPESSWCVIVYKAMQHV